MMYFILETFESKHTKYSCATVYIWINDKYKLKKVQPRVFDGTAIYFIMKKNDTFTGIEYFVGICPTRYSSPCLESFDGPHVSNQRLHRFL